MTTNTDLIAEARGWGHALVVGAPTTTNALLNELADALEAAVAENERLARLEATVSAMNWPVDQLHDALVNNLPVIRERDHYRSVIEKVRPVASRAWVNVESIDAEWGMGRSFDELVNDGDPEALEIQAALQALDAYDNEKGLR